MEYGCGVGRCTVWLARRFRRVVAFDISQPHLDAARVATAARGIDNVEFVLVRGPDDLSALNGADVFYSILVLQHNPPPIAIDILDAVFRGLKRGGVAFFQIPTYADDYSFETEDYNTFVRAKKEMEMHFVPQRTIFDLAFRHGLRSVEVQPDDLDRQVGFLDLQHVPATEHGITAPVGHGTGPCSYDRIGTHKGWAVALQPPEAGRRGGGRGLGSKVPVAGLKP